jgi:hypothetical protein
VGVEDHGLVLAKVLLDLVLDLGDLLAGDQERLVEARYLVETLGRVDLVRGYVDLALEVDEDLPVGDALLGGYALHDDLFLCAWFR